MALFGGICSFAFLFINIPADMVIVLFPILIEYLFDKQFTSVNQIDSTW